MPGDLQNLEPLLNQSPINGRIDPLRLIGRGDQHTIASSGRDLVQHDIGGIHACVLRPRDPAVIFTGFAKGAVGLFDEDFFFFLLNGFGGIH